MSRSNIAILLVVLLAATIAFYGCKAKSEKIEEMTAVEGGGIMPMEGTQITEPAQTVAMEGIPPTAAPAISRKTSMMPTNSMERNKEIQTALKNAGLYTGAIDGKIGPRTKMAIEEFQRAKGLKVDGIVGPRTWAELEKYLTNPAE